VSGTATAKVRVYAVNYNVLRVMTGMAGVAYLLSLKLLHFILNDKKSAEKQHASNKQAMFEGIFGLAPAVLAGC
jgi:hypothetical protein